MVNCKRNRKIISVRILFFTTVYVHNIISTLLIENLLVTFYSLQLSWLYMSPDIGRSKLIGVIRKTRNVFKNLSVLWKKKKLHYTINKYIETRDINTITSFYFTNSHFWDFLTQILVSVWITIFYILSPSSHELGFFRGWKSLPPISYGERDVRFLSINRIPGGGNWREEVYTWLSLFLGMSTR